MERSGLRVCLDRERLRRTCIELRRLRNCVFELVNFARELSVRVKLSKQISCVRKGGAGKNRIAFLAETKAATRCLSSPRVLRFVLTPKDQGDFEYGDDCF